MKKLTLRYKGGKGSGHHGHRGRPGKQGGSLPGKGSPGSGKKTSANRTPTPPKGWTKGVDKDAHTLEARLNGKDYAIRRESGGKLSLMYNSATAGSLRRFDVVSSHRNWEDAFQAAQEHSKTDDHSEWNAKWGIKPEKTRSREEQLEEFGNMLDKIRNINGLKIHGSHGGGLNKRYITRRPKAEVRSEIFGLGDFKSTGLNKFFDMKSRTSVTFGPATERYGYYYVDVSFFEEWNKED